MKANELEYKRRNRNNNTNRYTNNQRKSMLIGSELPEQDDFLESAQTFYRKQNYNNISRSRFFNQSITRKNQEVSRSKITETYQTLRKSIEKDKSSNLEHWRKQAFQYQQKLFMMEKELGKLKNENSELRNEIKCLKDRKSRLSKSRSKQKQLNTEINHKPDMMEIVKNQNQKIFKMNTQLIEKSQIIRSLEEQLKSYQNREEKQPFTIAAEFSFAQETARWSIKEERSTVVSKEPIDEEQLNTILQKIGKNIEQLEFKKGVHPCNAQSNE